MWGLNNGCLISVIWKLQPLVVFFVYSAPEVLQLYNNEPFYNEGATVNIVCRNRNQRPGFQGDEVWTNSTGGIVASGSTLTFTATRDLAGQYACSVPTVAEIIPYIMDIVVRRKL